MFELNPSYVLALLTVVLTLQSIISAVGKSTVLNWCWNVYSIIASKVGKPEFVELAQKRQELVHINKERKSISAQDQYAKWTKLNRSYDRASAEVKTLVSQVSTEKANVNKAVGMAITILTVVPVWTCRIWYRKTVLFYLPGGYMPHPLEWLLAFPFTVVGGIGIPVWMFAVNSLFRTISFLIGYMLEPAVPKPQKPMDKPAEKTQRPDEKPAEISP